MILQGRAEHRPHRRRPSRQAPSIPSPAPWQRPSRRRGRPPVPFAKPMPLRFSGRIGIARCERLVGISALARCFRAHLLVSRSLRARGSLAHSFRPRRSTPRSLRARRSTPLTLRARPSITPIYRARRCSKHVCAQLAPKPTAPLDVNCLTRQTTGGRFGGTAKAMFTRGTKLTGRFEQSRPLQASFGERYEREFSPGTERRGSRTGRFRFRARKVLDRRAGGKGRVGADAASRLLRGRFAGRGYPACFRDRAANAGPRPKRLVAPTCRENALVRVLEPSGSAIWKLAPTGVALHPLPASVEQMPGKIAELFPDIHARVASKGARLVVDKGSALTAEAVCWNSLRSRGASFGAHGARVSVA